MTGLLLDTHLLIAIAREEVASLPDAIRRLLAAPDEVQFASVGSLWEIAIKTRLGKLDPLLSLDELPAYLRSQRIAILEIGERHAVAEASPVPATRDPFDRLLLAQCAVENLRLVTLDRALARHPLAWQPA